MKQLPTRSALADLGTAIDRFGLDANESDVTAIARLAMELAPQWIVPTILADPTAPPAVRVRALVKLSSNWDRLQLRPTEPQTGPNDHSLAA